MSAEVLPLISAQSVATAQPIYFGTAKCRLFGWLHPAAKAEIGVVLCQPFGYEAICAHRGTRAFAEAIAAAGMPALRFDYLGTGDSAEIDPQADQLEAWTRDVLIAAEELQLLTGVKQICLLGFRLGAMLAALAAAQGNSVTSVISISPIKSGRRYLRELRTLRMAASMSADSNEHPSEQQDSLSGGIEVSGFRFSAATLATLATVELSTLSLPQMLVIESATAAASGDPVSSQDSKGQAMRLALPGLVEMLMTPPQFAQVPKAVIAATLDWLLHIPSQVAIEPSAPRANPSRLTATSTQLELAGFDNGSRSARIEHAVFFGTDGLLFGIVTTPPANEIRRRAVILLNAGADHHVGASRMYVSMARRWAKHGYVVLRMDLGGVGDSGTRPGRIDDDVFPKEALDDVAAGIDYLKRSHGIRDVTLAGLCSGAYHALRAAVAELPVNCILMVNPQNYFWKQGETLEGLQVAEVAHNPGLYRERIFSSAAWKRMVTGRVNVLRIGKIYLQRPLLAAESALRNLARRVHVRLPNDLGTELEQVVARGVRVVFVFARGEPGISLLRLQAGTAVERLAEHCRVHIINSGDHVFTRSAPRAMMEKTVSDELFARPEWVDMPNANVKAGVD